jgi:hypothetical protein
MALMFGLNLNGGFTCKSNAFSTKKGNKSRGRKNCIYVVSFTLRITAEISNSKIKGHLSVYAKNK